VKIRKAKGIAQDGLAELSTLHRSHLFKVETGRQSPTVVTLKLIADALSVRVRDLVKDL
jgi:transcriptional regulator with XRE-family HTH domain